jgi:hypothetical protein
MDCERGTRMAASGSERRRRSTNLAAEGQKPSWAVSDVRAKFLCPRGWRLIAREGTDASILYRCTSISPGRQVFVNHDSRGP